MIRRTDHARFLENSSTLGKIGKDFSRIEAVSLKELQYLAKGYDDNNSTKLKYENCRNDIK